MIPVAQTTPRRSLLASGATAVGREGLVGDSAQEGPVEAMDDRPEEHPHARGPEVIGMEDMGPQHHPVGEQRIDMEAAVGRSHSSPQPIPEAAEADSMLEDAKNDPAGEPGKDPKDMEKDVEMMKEKVDDAKENAAKDSEGDIVVADADGRSAEDANDEAKKAGGSGYKTGPDAVDTTSQ